MAAHRPTFLVSLFLVSSENRSALPGSSSPLCPFGTKMLAVSLPTLGFRSPMVAGIGVLRRHAISPPPPLLCFSGDFLLPTTPLFSAAGGARLILGPIRASGGSDQADDGVNYHVENSISTKIFTWANVLLKFSLFNFLPLALTCGIILGLANPTLGCLAHKYGLSRFSTFGIFFISGLMLRSREIGAAIEAWPVGMLGLVSILFVTPLLSKLILKIPLAPQEFVTGLAIFCCMPTTLSSGVALTNLVGGNSALALAVTVTSNLLGMMVVPFSLSMFVAAGDGVSIPTTQLFKSLVATLLVPLILGKVLRDASEGVAEFVDQNRRLFSMMNSAFLSLVPWIQVSRSRSLFLTVTPVAFASVISMGILLHLILLALNTVAVAILSVPFGGKKSVFAKKENARAFVIVASQKTLPVMVAVVEQLRGALGEPGLLVLPCVAWHINQIIIDSFLVNIWLQKDQLSSKTTNEM